MLRDNLVELIEPMLNSAGADPLALYIHTRTPASDDRLPCLKNPRPEGAESSLTESASSPFQAEPAHHEQRVVDIELEKTLRGKVGKQTFPLRLGIPQKTRDSHFPTAATTTALRLHFKWRDDPPHGYILRWLDAVCPVGTAGRSPRSYWQPSCARAGHPAPDRFWQPKHASRVQIPASAVSTENLTGGGEKGQEPKERCAHGHRTGGRGRAPRLRTLRELRDLHHPPRTH